MRLPIAGVPRTAEAAARTTGRRAGTPRDQARRVHHLMWYRVRLKFFQQLI